MARDFRYVVYRKYSPIEQPDPDFRYIMYGWSYHKSVIKMFFKQRSREKYVVRELTDDQIIAAYSETFSDNLKMIDILPLRSSKMSGTFYLYTTQAEMQTAEKKIQLMVHDIPALKNFPNNGDYLELIYNLKPRYANALETIGYRIPDFDMLYPSEDYHDDPSDFRNIEEQIDKAYGQRVVPRGVPPGTTELQNFNNQILCSLEAFISVLAEDM